MKIYKYLYFFIFLNIYIFCFQNGTNISYINRNETSIQNGVYIIRNNEGNLNLEFSYNFHFINNPNKNLKKNFELIKWIDNNFTEEFFIVKEKDSNAEISADEQNNIIEYKKNLENDLKLWKIIPKINNESKLVYYVQNKKNKKFWELKYNYNGKFELSETENIEKLNKHNEFLFVEMFKEVEKKESKLLNDEPIDIFIKYIDLSDPKLNRTGIKQIPKDQDNEELRYSIRSILKNIPWIRKIFIVMPNEKVRFFKPQEEINEKIIYVKDKDFLGFDSASSCVFQYNLFRMRKFGLSENFILMDDDYFIAQPLNKSDFFYEENGTILPALVTSDYYEINKQKLKERMINNLNKKNSQDSHSEFGFAIQQVNSLLFLFDIFGEDDIRHGKKLIEPAFSHNANPMKLSDIEELYFIILNQYKNSNLILNSLVRTNNDLQFQTLYIAYVKNKYDRKVSKISSAFYDLRQSRKILYNRAKLFVINTSSRQYREFYYKREEEMLNSLFPEKTKYEIEAKEIGKYNKNNLVDELIKDYKRQNRIFSPLKEENNNLGKIDFNYSYFGEIKNNKIKQLDENFSVIFNIIEDKFDEYKQKENETIVNQKNSLSELEKEITDLKYICKWQNKIIYFLFFFTLLFV